MTSSAYDIFYMGSFITPVGKQHMVNIVGRIRVEYADTVKLRAPQALNNYLQQNNKIVWRILRKR